VEWLLLPVVILLILLAIGPLTDRLGWTRTRGQANAGLGAMLETGNAITMGHTASVEYRKEVHDEEDGEGDKPRRPFFPGIHDGALTIRPLIDCPEDIASLARWLSDEQVLSCYEGRDNPHDEEKVRKVFFEELPDHEVPCLVEWEGRPIGYLQFYRLGPEALEQFGYAPDSGVYGMDQFIGEPSLWNRGIGSRMLRLMLAYLFEMEGARRVVVDPIVANGRAIRAYEKTGFQKVRFMPAYAWHEGQERDAWLMEVTPQSVRPETYPCYLKWK